MTSPTTTWTQFKTPDYDRLLAATVLGLLLLGWVMVASSSIAVAGRLTGHPWYFTIRHGVYLAIALTLGFAVMKVPLKHWETLGPHLLVGGLLLLLLVLVAGREVNGSKRWLDFGVMTVQASELVKLFVVVYMASYLVRRGESLRTELQGFVRPLLVMGLVTVLLLLEPDFGASAVIVATVLGMMFLGGARLWQFVLLLVMVSIAMLLVLSAQSYRVERLKAFLDPWSDPYGSGYQLTQSLIAFGRGGLTGEGLGLSIQKLSFLPEAHTDFVVAILAEELGFVGVTLLVLAFTALLWRALAIGSRALKQGRLFAGYLSYGIGFGLFLQAMVNIGVASGLLPTKGITLPLVSYGGSSLIVSVVMIGLLLRADFEGRIPVAKGGRS
jgi:cell division protein FtsW